MKKRFAGLTVALALCLGLILPASAMTIVYPSGPAEETSAPPAGPVAAPTNDRLTVDGVLQNPTVYKIGGSNYFKIRDLAAVLNGTGKQFSVGYDGATNSVTATTGQGYAKLAGDLAGPPAGGNKSAVLSNDAIYVDGARIQAEVYKIDGSNYFKLRDLGTALGFSVDWNAAQGMIVSTTGTAAPETPTETETPAATLANGKPVTEENVLAIMAEVEREYPDGTPWDETGMNPNKVSKPVYNLIERVYRSSSLKGCGGFASMLSDRIFGYDAPCRKLDDNSKVRPGDLIVEIFNAKPRTSWSPPAPCTPAPQSWTSPTGTATTWSVGPLTGTTLLLIKPTSSTPATPNEGPHPPQCAHWGTFP